VFNQTRFWKCIGMVGIVPLLGIVLGCGTDQRIDALPPDAVLVAFGNSLTAGTGAPQGASYPSVLAQLTGYTVHNAGVPGELSREGLQRLPRVLQRYKPDVVLLCHGGNDFLQNRSTAELKKHLRAMIHQIRGAGARVVLLGVPRFDLGLSTHPLYGELAEEFDLPAELDALDAILATPRQKSDMIHPNAAGYARLARAVAELLPNSASAG